MTDDHDRLRAEVRALRRQIGDRPVKRRSRRVFLIAAAALLLGTGAALHVATAGVTARITLPDLAPQRATSGFVEAIFTRY